MTVVFMYMAVRIVLVSKQRTG